MISPDPRRRGLLLYLAIVLVGSAGLQSIILLDGRPITEQGMTVVLMMWLPALASVIARLVFREGFGDVSFRLRPVPAPLGAWAIAWLYPVAVGVIAYGAAFALGLNEVRVPDTMQKIMGDADWGKALSVSIAINLTLGTLLSAISAAGEEIGWRGYMLTRLIDVGVPQPVLVSGLIWGAWHLPLILSGQYASGPYPALSALLFMVSILPASFVAAELRLVTGSVWSAVLFHAAWNAVIQGSFDAFTKGHDAAHAGSIWVGESGLLVSAASIAVSALCCRYLRRQRLRAELR